MRRMLGALLGLAVACAACSDGGTDDVSSTTTAPTTSTTTAPEATTTTSTTAPVPFDIEVRRAAIELLAIRNDVFMHPDVSRVSEYIADTCTCLERERGFIERFVAEGLTWGGPPIHVVGIALDNEDPRNPLLTFVSTQPGTSVLSSDGREVQAVPPDDSTGFRIALVSAAPSEWRINFLEGVSLNDEVLASIVAEGLP